MSGGLLPAAWSTFGSGTGHSIQEIERDMDLSLMEMMREIYGTERMVPTQFTIIDSDVNQIRHLFFHLRAENRNIDVSYGIEVFQARIADVDDDQVMLRIPGFEEGPQRRIRIRFDAVNIFYQFEVIIEAVSGELVSIRMPDSIQSATRRKYRRVYPDDVFLRFLFVYRPIFGKRGIGQIVEDRYSYLVEELKKDYPDLSLILRMVAEELHSISRHFEFKFYKKGEKRSLMEQVVTSQESTLYIRDTDRLDNYFRKLNLFGLTNYEREFKNMLNVMSEEEARTKFEEIQQSELRQHLYNYVCAPLTIFDQVVGHIYLHTTVLEKHQITTEDATRIDILATLLSYAMSRTAVARTYYREPLARLRNISIAGLLFEIRSHVLFDYLIDHDSLRVLLPLKNDVLEMEGDITRLFPVEDHFLIGMKFTGAGPDDFRRLENYIFQRLKSRHEASLRSQDHR
ncbi:MAG: DUF1577 domain-containing protein [Leptospiraceae bacterium]|nr:DUF1577 domain-containing protein [Leptospiraceae bacterium]